MSARAMPIGPLLGVLVLAACAGVSAGFVKPGATREEIRADNATCRAEAEARMGRESNITHDIRSGDNRAGSDSRRLLEQTRDIGTERRYDRIFAACMKARGYARKKE